MQYSHTKRAGKTLHTAHLLFIIRRITSQEGIYVLLCSKIYIELRQNQLKSFSVSDINDSQYQIHQDKLT